MRPRSLFIKTLLSELGAGLGRNLRIGDHNNTMILTPTDEITYWGDQTMSSPQLIERERAQFFHQLFQPMSADCKDIGAPPRPAIHPELVDGTA